MLGQRCPFSVFICFAIAIVTSGVAFAQEQQSCALSGAIVDLRGAGIAGAAVAVRGATGGVEASAVSTERGGFTISGLRDGTYTVTVTARGYKTTTLAGIAVEAGLETTVTVVLAREGDAPGGVGPAGPPPEPAAPRASDASPVLPPRALALSAPLPRLTESFFARVKARTEPFEPVTVAPAAPGAQKATSQPVTRSGSNKFTGSSYYYLRHDALNANSWFNNRDLPPDPRTGKAPKTAMRQYQPGIRLGGPIVLPGLFDGRDKAFFFVNYEEARSPGRSTLTRTILHPDSQHGIFRYSTAAGVEQVDLLALAARYGQDTALDPTVVRLLEDMRAASSGTGQITDLSEAGLQQFVFQTPVTSYAPTPSFRIDYNLSDAHRVSGSFNYQHINTTPDAPGGQQVRFPGFPIFGSLQSTRYSTTQSLRSTFGRDFVNELRVGASGGATFFSPEKNAGMWEGPVADQGGFQLNLNAAGISNAGSDPNPSARENSTKDLTNRLNWTKGRHTFVLGGAFTQADLWIRNQTLVPTVNFGIATGDPAETMFDAANFPGASSSQLSAAKSLYAVLTGRVSSISGNARLNERTNEYEFLGAGVQRGRMREYALSVQDSWRVRPNVTVNYGLRYELQRPFYALNNSYSTATLDDVWGVSGAGHLFAPGVLTGRKPAFIAFTKGTPAYRTDWNNLAPSLEVSWSAGKRTGPLGALLGDDGATVLKGGYGLDYLRHGLGGFSSVFADNPGIAIDASRSSALGNLDLDGAGLPLLLQDRSRLGPPPFPVTQQYPYTEVVTGDLSIFDPHLQVPYVQTFTASVARRLSKDISVELRYAGTRHLQDWAEFNFNEPDIIENGFLEEFRRAQGNLQANIAAGLGNTFAYTGAPGTSPLPIYLAYLNGVGAADAGSPSAYSGDVWTSSNFTNPLAVFNPNPFVPAGTTASSGLDGDPERRANAAAAGLPVNFFRVNPDLLGGVNVIGNGVSRRQDSMQLEVRKRLSHGFQVDGSYGYMTGFERDRYSLRLPWYKTPLTGWGPTHALRVNWVWELPFGNGRRWLGQSHGLLERLAGGWELDGIARVQSGRMVDVGNVRLVGMTAGELRRSVGLHTYAVTGLNPDAATALYLLPRDIVENTVRAFNVSATSPTGYGSLGPPAGRYLAPANGPDCIETAPGAGQCGMRSLILTGPRFTRVDMSVVKRVNVVGRTNFEFRAEMLNAFNHPNFFPTISTSPNADAYRITNVLDTSSRIVQLVMRLTW